jgi:hypothetical protein
MGNDKLTDTDMDPGTPHGAGESTTRRGEDIRDEDGVEAGREPEVGTSGADRPYGKSTARDVTSIDPQDPIDPDMMGGSDSKK